MTICKHKDMFGCSNKMCSYRGKCDGIIHTGMSEEEIAKLSPSEIGDGDCCVFSEVTK